MRTRPVRLNPFRKRRTCTELKCGRCVEVRAQQVANELADGCEYTTSQLFHYALATVVLGVPTDRALVYLQDCGIPESALGRLYLRAGERAMRDTGESVEYREE